jgi:hypothetical protein
MNVQPTTKRGKYLARHTALKNEQSSWMSHWREISDNLMPRQGRFFVSDRNKGEKRHNTIYDSTGSKALNTLASGLMAGMTSPARPWFRLAVSDTRLMQNAAVRAWLDDVGVLMREVFARSNFYRALHSMYKELGGFGTAATIILPDYDNVIHCYPLTIGEYAIATNSKGKVDTLYREFDMTVGQLVDEFGLDNVSLNVKQAYERRALDTWVTVLHVIEPRKDRDLKMKDAKNMAFASVYLEVSSPDPDKMLRESGFKRFPAIVPRWDVTGGDIYGNSPAMEALGDVMQLQHEQVRKAEGIDYQTKPPLQVPTALRGNEDDLLPGGVSYYDAAAPTGGIRSAFEVNLNLQHLLMDIQDVRERIRSTFYADLFLMLANDQRSGTTAREIAERHEEKLLMLGPVLERLHNEMLAPGVDITFERLVEAEVFVGDLAPPKELEGKEINVEFVSMLAQAQRAVATGSIDRLLGTVGGLAQLKPEVLDKLNGDEIIEAYADMLGVDPDLITSDEAAAVIREQRAQQQQAAQQAAAMPEMINAAKTASETSTADGSMLSDLTRQFTQL